MSGEDMATSKRRREAKEAEAETRGIRTHMKRLQVAQLERVW